SRNPRDFWRRWHMTLSAWVRDYLFIPLGGARKGPLVLYRNLMVVMVLVGLWHGASWTFVVWGTYQGILLVGYRLFNQVTAGTAMSRLMTKRKLEPRRVALLFTSFVIGMSFVRAMALQATADGSRAVFGSTH